jgi:thymidylate synthase
VTLHTFDNVAEAYSAGLHALLEKGATVPSVRESTSVASGFGTQDRPSIELLGYGFEIQNPEAVLIECAACQPRLAYYFGLLTWSLTGSDDVATLAYYHPSAPRFSDDGAHLSGAFGHRLFCHVGGSQVAAMVHRLRNDPASRRAIATILDASDNFRTSREFPCASTVQLFLRDERLDCIVNMRAQQALFVLPYDVLIFIGLQILVAAELEVGVGSYRHFAGTFHIYANEYDLAEAVVASQIRARSLSPPTSRLDSQIAELRDWECRLRSMGAEGDIRGLDGITDEVASIPNATLTGQAARVFLHKAAEVIGHERLADRAAAELPELAEMMRLRNEQLAEEASS